MLYADEVTKGRKIVCDNEAVDYKLKRVPEGTKGIIKVITYGLFGTYAAFIIAWGNGITTNHANSHLFVSKAN